jgi:hypothetical protein
MSKRLIAVAALALAPLAPAHADNAAGCGIGTQIFQGKSGMAFHVLAATTNGSFGNQTFGMTSGTLGCKADGPVTASAELKEFASANLDQLAIEMASGEGEALTALAGLYGIDAGDRTAFYSMAKTNYGTIVSSDEVTAGDMLTALHTLMAADARLARYVA